MPGAPLLTLSNGDAARGLGLLDRHPIRDVVGGDEIERRRGEPGPQRVLVGHRPERRRDHALARTEARSGDA